MSSKEIELKLELPVGSVPALKKLSFLQSLKPPPKRTNEVSVYFDTRKHKLHNNGLTLRVRRIGDRYVQTIKSSENSGAFERDEWESELRRDKPDLRLAKGTALEPLAKKKLRRQLKPLFETRVQRTHYPVCGKGHAIALTIDRGVINCGERSSPLCEVELELEHGSPADLFGTARALMETVPAELAVKSKSERGYELVDDKLEAPVKAGHIELAPAVCARDAFRTIGRACLKQVVGNQPALLAGDPEGVHQMRVGLRRFRAAMSLFRDLLQDDQTAAIKAQFKWLTGELGPARELDVLVKRVLSPTKKKEAHFPGLMSFSNEVAKRREAALARAQEAVRSRRYRALTLDVAAWLEAGTWRTVADDLVRDLGDLPIAVFAADELTRRRRKVRKKGKSLGELDPESRHKLRIQTKKLRYAADFFNALVTGKRASARKQRFFCALERLQDGLGDLNDIAVHEQRIERLGLHSTQVSRKEAFAAGLLTGHEDAWAAAAMTAAKKAYAAFAKCKPYW